MTRKTEKGEHLSNSIATVIASERSERADLVVSRARFFAIYIYIYIFISISTGTALTNENAQFQGST